MKSRKIIAAVSLAVILVLVVGTTTASAASLSELRKQISEKQSELDEGKKQEESLSQKLNELEEAIAQNEDKLIVLEEDLRAAEEKVETQTTNLNSRLRNMYKNGSVGFLDVLLNSGSPRKVCIHYISLRMNYKGIPRLSAMQTILSVGM